MSVGARHYPTAPPREHRPAIAGRRSPAPGHTRWLITVAIVWPRQAEPRDVWSHPTRPPGEAGHAATSRRTGQVLASHSVLVVVSIIVAQPFHAGDAGLDPRDGVPRDLRCPR